MRLEDKTVFVEVLASVCEVYGKAYPSQAVFDLWFAALADFDVAQVKQGFTAYIQGASENSHFMPKPADIVGLINGDGEVAAMQAWAKARDAMASVGRYQSVCFDDARIHATIALLGGWLAFCDKGDVGEMKWLELKFVKIYQGLKSFGEYPSYLIGLAENQNLSNGFADFVRPPVPVGDVARAREVYRLGVRPQGATKGLLSAQKQSEKMRDFSELKALVAM